MDLVWTMFPVVLAQRSPQTGLSLIPNQEIWAQYHLHRLWMSLDSLIHLYIYIFPRHRFPTASTAQNIIFFYHRQTGFENTPHDSNVVLETVSDVNVARLTLVSTTNLHFQVLNQPRWMGTVKAQFYSFPHTFCDFFQFLRRPLKWVQTLALKKNFASL